MNQHSHGSDAAQLQVAMRRRNENQAEPPQPVDRASIIIPDTYWIYEVAPGQMEEFILWDSGEQDKNRILLFGRQSNREWIHLNQKLYVDGTFSLAPALFSEIYAAIGAIRTKFPNCAIHECPFHLTKNMRRKLEEEGLLRKYNTDHDFALAARMIVALSFAPIEDIDVAFEELEKEIAEDLPPILNCALFSPYMWSVYERTVNGEDRTNNSVEAARRTLQAEFGMDHPNIWKFKDGIRCVQNGRDL
ncbi:hypothetical protein HZS_1451, partial [Henneguya salminicola]